MGIVALHNTTTKNTSKLLLGLFLRRLPLQMRSQLANHPANYPAKLADDAILSQSEGQVSAAAVMVAGAILNQPTRCCPALYRWELGPPVTGSQDGWWSR